MKRNSTEHRHDPRETPEEAHARLTMDATAYRAFLNRSLQRRIWAWAKLHEKCPRGGCRRNGRCLDLEDCRAASSEPITEEERLALGRQVRAAMEEVLARRAAAGETIPLLRPRRD